MTKSTIRPRLDQIAELTRGVALPLSGILDIHLEIIAEGIHQAFNSIKLMHPSTVNLGSEAEVTALLISKLNNMAGEDPIWGQLVLNVGRGTESLSYDGSHLEKRPDLSIHLSGRNRNFPLIAEAKIIDSASSKTEALYCFNGIRRFEDGEYAWGNREAFMLAYVRDGSTINSILTPYLARQVAQTPPSYLIKKLPEIRKSIVMDLAVSKHGRRFRYTGVTSPNKRPGLITVWHLWMT